MSVKQMGLVWDLDLAPNKRLVLLAYADHADDEGGSVFPSLARVAHKTGYSRDQVRRISRELAAGNLMVKVAEATHNKGAEYRLTLERGSKLPPLHPPGVGANDPPGVGAPVPPEPSVEPSVNSRRDAQAPPDASAEASAASPGPLSVMKNPFGYYCEVAKALRVTIVPEDRDQTSKHFKDLIRTDHPTEEELKRVVSKMLEARTAGVFWSPQKALEKVRSSGANVTPLRAVEPVRPRKKVIL